MRWCAFHHTLPWTFPYSLWSRRSHESKHIRGVVHLNAGYRPPHPPGTPGICPFSAHDHQQYAWAYPSYCQCLQTLVDLIVHQIGLGHRCLVANLACSVRQGCGSSELPSDSCACSLCTWIPRSVHPWGLSQGTLELGRLPSIRPHQPGCEQYFNVSGLVLTLVKCALRDVISNWTSMDKLWIHADRVGHGLLGRLAIPEIK